MNENVEELRLILKNYNPKEPAYKGCIDVEVLQGVLQEIERLNNIINELEKELKDRIKNVPETMSEVYEDKSILHKLQELKGSD